MAAKKASFVLEGVKVNDTTPFRVTAGSSLTTNEMSPLFAPDGNIVAFAGDDEKTIYQVDVKTKKVSVLLTVPVPITTFKWSPSGKYIVFSAKVYLDCPDLQCTADRNAAVEAQGANRGMIFTQLYVRHWDTWETEGAYSHLFVQSVVKQADGSYKPAGAPLDLMYKQAIASPVPPFGGSEQYDISSTGDEIAFTGETIEHETAWKTGWKVFTVKPNSQQPVHISTMTEARCQNPQYSPSGKQLMYLCMDRTGLESDKLHFNLLDRTAQQTKTDFPQGWDRSIGDYSWINESEVFIVADENAFSKVFTFNLGSGALAEVVSTGHSSAPIRVGKTGQYIYSWDSMTTPADLWSLTFNGKVPVTKRITNYNPGLADFQLQSPEQFYFTSTQDTKVQGWILKPTNFQEGKTYPLAFLIHGGPEGAWDDAWSFRWNPQLWANHGYAVVFVNPRGSSGFGQAFQDAVRHDWGGEPFNDLMKGLDHVLATYKFVDKDRMCACGASYGGFMINFVNGHTDRFKCLVNHDGVFSSMGMYYSSEEVFFNEAEFAPPPFMSKENRDAYEKFSPVNFVANWKTPTLVVHGGRDYRIPEAEGLGTFTALQRKGIPSKLLYFPMENHWVLKPENSILWYHTVLDWLDLYAKPAAINA